MKKGFMRRVYWLLPVLVMIIGLLLLFRDNYLQVTEPPETGWSNALPIGSTISSQTPRVSQTDQGHIIVPGIKDGNLTVQVFNENFDLAAEDSYAIATDKWSDVFVTDDSLIYFTKHTIYDQNNNKITDADLFLPLDSMVLYTKDNKLFQLDPDQKESVALLTLDEKQHIVPDPDSGTFLLYDEKNETDTLALELYETKNGKVELLTTRTLPVKPGRELSDLNFTAADGKFALVMQTKQQNAQGAADFQNHFLQTPLAEPDGSKPEKISLPDPVTGEELKEVSNIAVRLKEGVPHLLFRANGYTNTPFNGKYAFNIYEAVIAKNGGIKTARRSNTPGSSAKPAWLGDSAVVWTEPEADGNTIYTSSENPAVIAKASTFNRGYFLDALGKTMGKTAVALLMIFISFIWFIWPLAFIVGMHLFKSRILDREPRWIFYTGIAIYLAAALLFKNVLFTNNIMATAPAYLTFTGSFYLYMAVFALIAFAGVRLAGWKEWSISANITYFAGAHIFMFTAFFGPYLV